MAKRVVVFLDWQNVYKCARESFHTEEAPGYWGQVKPLELAQVIASQVSDGELKQVRVYRGLPSNEKNPKGYGAVRKQTSVWKSAGPAMVDVFVKPLQYLEGEPPREKGVDVALAIDFVTMAIRDQYDIGVLFSVDTDLKPALDFVYELNGTALPWPRVAAWDGPNHHRRCITASGKRKVPCCWVSTTDYYKLRDLTKYVE